MRGRHDLPAAGFADNAFAAQARAIRQQRESPDHVIRRHRESPGQTIGNDGNDGQRRPQRCPQREKRTCRDDSIPCA